MFNRVFFSLTVALLCAVFTSSAHAQDFTYTTTAGTITITGYTGTNIAVAIPATINGLPVTSIGNGAFYYKTTIASVTIPNSVTSIGRDAFYVCTSLTSVTIPNSVTSIGVWAFRQCTSLTSVTIGNSVTSIHDSVFSGCTSLTSVTIPNSVTGIGRSAFQSCTSLTSVTIGNSVTFIGSSAFQSCTSLTSVTIPNSVTSIGSYAFRQCTSLTSVTIPNSVTSIGSWAFRQCTSLTSVTIPNSVTFIGSAVFASCTSLTSVTIGNSVTSIGHSAFQFCTSLTSVTIPKSVTIIGSFGFASCTSLTSITVDASNPSYSSVDGILFSKSQTTLIQCPGGKAGSYTIPDSVTSMGEGAFSGCTSLTSVTIPNSVTSMGEGAFSGCTSLTSITVDASNPSYSSVDGVLFNKSQTTLIQCPGGKVGSYTIPDSVTISGEGAFRQCTSLTRVTIPDSVTSMGEGVFSRCTSLTSVTIGNSITSLGRWAFSGCTSLTGVYFRGNAPSIGAPAFASADQATVYYLPGTLGWGATFGGRPTALWLPPRADASATQPLWISANGLNAAVVLDGSRSSDPDGDPLSYSWFSGSTSIAQGVIAVVPLPVGVNGIDLVVDDGLAQATNTVTITVLTTEQAVESVIARVNESDLPHKQPLLTSLNAALASIERGNCHSALGQLHAFQNKVRAQVHPDDPVLATELVEGAGQVIAALDCDGSPRIAAKFHSLKRHPNGKMQMKIKGEAGKSYVLEASTNLVDWEAICVVRPDDEGNCGYEDAAAAKHQSRFYRVVER